MLYCSLLGPPKAGWGKRGKKASDSKFFCFWLFALGARAVCQVCVYVWQFGIIIILLRLFFDIKQGERNDILLSPGSQCNMVGTYIVSLWSEFELWFPTRTFIWNFIEQSLETKLKTITRIRPGLDSWPCYWWCCKWPLMRWASLGCRALHTYSWTASLMGEPVTSPTAMNQLVNMSSWPMWNLMIVWGLVGGKFPLRLAHKKWTPPSQPNVVFLPKTLARVWEQGPFLWANPRGKVAGKGLRMDIDPIKVFGAKYIVIFWGLWDPTLPKNPKVAQVRVTG